MKRKIIPALLTVLLVATSIVSVSAAEVTDVNTENSTEVTAKIVNPGSVSYVITIPATADFGTLTVPENTESDHYTFSSFQVEATNLNIMSGTAVSVWLMDAHSTEGKFIISQKNVGDPFTIEYDVYDSVVNASSDLTSLTPVNNTASGQNGYQLVTFRSNQQGAAQDVTLALNQNALYGKDLGTIAGDYSGTIKFHSSLIAISGN